MMRTCNLFLAIFWIAIVVSLMAQNEVPQIIGIYQLPVTGSYISDFVIIDGAGYIAANYPHHLYKVDLATQQVQWVGNITASWGWGTNNNVIKTPDGNICYSDGPNIVKLSTQGDTLWTCNLSSYGDYFALSGNSQAFLTCYSISSNLVLLDYGNGQIINHWSIVTGGFSNCSDHAVHATADSTFYLFDDMPMGILYNTASKVTKIKIIDNIAVSSWYLKIDDAFGSNGCVFPDIYPDIYLICRQVDPWSNGLIYKIIDQGDDYQIESIIDIAGPDSIGFTINPIASNNQLLVPAYIRLGDDPNGEDGYSGAIMCYDNQANLVWRVNQTIMPFCYTQAVAIDSNKIYGISCCHQTYGGPRTFWLTELSTTVANDDPVTPAIPDPDLSCYPNPFRGSTNVKFTQIDNSPTTIAIYNIKGQLVRTLIDGQKLPLGEQTIAWDGKTNAGQIVAAGIYFYKINSGRYSSTKKIVFLK